MLFSAHLFFFTYEIARSVRIRTIASEKHTHILYYTYNHIIHIYIFWAAYRNFMFSIYYILHGI